MTNWYALSAEVEYKKSEFQRDADFHRLLNKIESAPESKSPIICIILDRLGQGLVELGMVLRTRYGISAQ